MERSHQIAHLIKVMIGYHDTIHVSEYCYNCLMNGTPKKKTLIVLPDQLEDQGIISIDKPINEITHLDLIMNYKRLKQSI